MTSVQARCGAIIVAGLPGDPPWDNILLDHEIHCQHPACRGACIGLKVTDKFSGACQCGDPGCHQ